MRKFIAFLLTLLLVLSLCGCKEKTKAPEESAVPELQAQSPDLSSGESEPEKTDISEKEENVIYSTGKYMNNFETEDAYYVLGEKDDKLIIDCFDKEFNYKWTAISQADLYNGRSCCYILNDDLLIYSKGLAELYNENSATPLWRENISAAANDFLPIGNFPDKFYLNERQYIDINGKLQESNYDPSYGECFFEYYYFEDCSFSYMKVGDYFGEQFTLVALNEDHQPQASYTFAPDSYIFELQYEPQSKRLYACLQEYVNESASGRVICFDENLNVIFEKTSLEQLYIRRVLDDGTMTAQIYNEAGNDNRWHIIDTNLNSLYEEPTGGSPGELVPSETGFNSVFQFMNDYRHMEYDKNFKVVTYERVQGRAFINNEGVLVKITAK